MTALSDIWKKNFKSINAELEDFGTLAGPDRVIIITDLGEDHFTQYERE